LVALDRATDIFGREEEVGRIDRFLDRVSERPEVLLLQGEPGIGKTALWSFGLEAARGRGWSVLVCRPVRAEAPLTFSALGDLLASVPQPVLDVLPAPQRHALDVALLRRPPADAPPDQRAVAVATLGVLRTLAASTPVLVAVDDLPWLDSASAATLEYALRRLTTERAGLMATVSSDATDDKAAALDQSLVVERMDVGPLDLSSFGAMLNAKRDRDISWPDLNRLFDASGGNPSFGQDLLGSLDAGGTGKPLAVPASLRASAERRLQGVSAAAQEVLLLASASGRPTMEQILAISGEAPANAALEEAEAAGLVVVTTSEVRFTHPTLRFVRYSAATASQRRRAHARLADATSLPADRARHLALAATGPDEDLARELDVQAQLEHLRGAAVAGAELADLAVTLTPRDDTSARSLRLVAASDLHLAAFDPGGARLALEEAVTLSDHGRWRAEVLHRLARVVAYDDSLFSSFPLMEQALEESQPETPLRAYLHRDLAFLRAMAEGMGAAAEHIAAVEELIPKLADPDLSYQTDAHRVLVDFVAGNGLRPEGVARVTETQSQHGRIAMEIRPRVVVGRVLMYADDLAGARKLLLDEYDDVMAEGAETDLPLLLMPLVELETIAGELELAGTYANECTSAAAASGATAQLACAHASRAMLLAWRGPEDACRADADRGIAAGLRCGVLYAVAVACRALGLLSFAAADPAAAHASLGLVTEALAGRGMVDPGFIPVRAVLDDIEALIRMGELDSATALLEPLAAAAVRLDRASALAMTGRCQALLASARGEDEAAFAFVEAALSAHARIEAPLEEARTELVASEVARRARRTTEARRHAEAASTIFNDRGATLWAVRAGAELGRLERRRATAAGGGELTQTEHTVAEAVAAGRTNREVATELSMGLRTVEAHLSAIYRKLGVRSRSELAARWPELAPHSDALK
jgi:DNA-binding CsgD family transcriptional regulator